VGEIPTSNIQHPEKLQASSLKHQRNPKAEIRRPKEGRSSKSEVRKADYLTWLAALLEVPQFCPYFGDMGSALPSRFLAFETGWLKS
jgi:hypothetical protein